MKREEEKASTKKEIKSVIFDMDGVLIDSLDAWAKTVALAAKHFSDKKVTYDDFKKLFGQGTEQDIEMFMPGRTVEEVEEFYTENFPKFISETKLIQNAKETLEELKNRKIMLAVATNTNHGLAEKQLEIVGIKDYFDAIVGGDEVDNPKPFPDLINKALKKLNAKKEEAVYVGDTIFDVDAGKKAGIFTIGFKIQADGYIENMVEILEYVKRKC